MRFNLTLDKGNYRIDFTLDRKRKRLYLGTKDEITAKQIHKQMVYEWEAGQFDLSLDRYRFKNRKQPEVIAKAESNKNDVAATRLLSLWDKWVDSLHLSESTKNGHYYFIRQTIKKHDPLATDVIWFVELRDTWSVKTWTDRRNYLKSCIQWAISEGIFEGKNSYSKLKSLKDRQPDKVKPFSPEEISRILHALDTDQFSHPCSPYRHSHYSSFVRFLFMTGCRLGEATGLTWNCIDFQNRIISIRQALGKDLSISPYTSRKVLKETKTGKVHYIPMNVDLFELLSRLEEEHDTKTLNGFIFKGHRGKYIDTGNFRRRVWKPVLEALDIEYRYPYQARHTVLSAVASSQGLLAAASLAGHKSLDMVSRHYARFTDEIKLPNFEADFNDK